MGYFEPENDFISYVNFFLLTYNLILFFSYDYSYYKLIRQNDFFT